MRIIGWSPDLELVSFNIYTNSKIVINTDKNSYLKDFRLEIVSNKLLNIDQFDNYWTIRLLVIAFGNAIRLTVFGHRPIKKRFEKPNLV